MTDDQLLEYFKSEAKKFETPNRYAHSLGVYEECMYYAEKLFLREDERKTLSFASVLHDITKDFDDVSQKSICDRHGLKYETSPTLHQDTGAFFIRDNYGRVLGEKTDAVASAVSKHTTGGNNMSVCDMVLFIADYTEPGRKYENCVKAREYIHSECEKITKKDRSAVVKLLAGAVYDICTVTIRHLKARGETIDIRTENTRALMHSLMKE